MGIMDPMGPMGPMGLEELLSGCLTLFDLQICHGAKGSSLNQYAVNDSSSKWLHIKQLPAFPQIARLKKIWKT
jgi:hypothetical protein